MADALRRAVETWRAARYDRLRQPLSWLTLSGLDWLEPGTTAVPGGEIVVGEGSVVARGTGDDPLRHAGQRLGELALVADADAGPDGPTLLEHGPLRMALIRRGERLGVRTWDTASPARTAFAGIDHYPVDGSWRVRARFEATPDRRLPVPDVLGDVSDEPSPGTVHFAVAGREQRIAALAGDDGGELWLVFGDATNGGTTYGGGRFLYAAAPDAADGTLWLDFNRAYNPPCVFSPWATCPLPPGENRLDVAIEAGERIHPRR